MHSGRAPAAARGGRGIATLGLFRSCRPPAIDDELVIDEDASGVVEEQDFETARHDLVAAGRQHLPMEGDDVAQRASIVRGPEAMVALAHVLLLRADIRYSSASYPRTSRSPT